MASKTSLELAEKLIAQMFGHLNSLKIGQKDYFDAIGFVAACIFSTGVHSLYKEGELGIAKTWVAETVDVVNKSLLNAFDEKVPVQFGVTILEKENTGG